MARKVLQVIASLRTGGAQSLLVYTLEHLRRQSRYEFAVASVLPGGLFVPGLKAIGIPVYSLDVPVPWDIRAIPRLRRLIREVKPDLIHCHLFYADVYTVLANRGPRRVPLVYTQHSEYNARRAIPPFRLWDGAVVRQFERVVAVGEQTRVALIEWTGIDPSRTLVSPNGLNLDNFPAVVDREEVRAALGLRGDEFAVVCVARLADSKGIDRLLDTANALRAEGRRFRVLIVGDGPMRGPLEAYRDRLGLGNVVEFLGTRTDVPALLVASDLFTLSSLWEGLPIALLEAMGSYKPAVATSVGAIAEVIRDGVDGYVVPPDDVPALTAAIGRVMDLTPAERAEMGRQARQRISDEYSIATIGYRLLDLYDEVLGSYES